MKSKWTPMWFWGLGAVFGLWFMYGDLPIRELLAIMIFMQIWLTFSIMWMIYRLREKKENSAKE